MAQKLPLSGAAAGNRNIKIATSATPGTLLHTAHATAMDEVWIELTNTGTAAVAVTLELGGVTAPDDNMVVTVPPKSGFSMALGGHPFTGGVAVRAFAATANVINAHGWVNRIG